MSLAPSHAELIEQWLALGGVPRDRSTRDFVCDELLFKLWDDRQQWVQAAVQLMDGPDTGVSS